MGSGSGNPDSPEHETRKTHLQGVRDVGCGHDGAGRAMAGCRADGGAGCGATDEDAGCGGASGEDAGCGGAGRAAARYLAAARAAASTQAAAVQAGWRREMRWRRGLRRCRQRGGAGSRELEEAARDAGVGDAVLKRKKEVGDAGAGCLPSCVRVDSFFVLSIPGGLLVIGLFGIFGLFGI